MTTEWKLEVLSDGIDEAIALERARWEAEVQRLQRELEAAQADAQRLREALEAVADYTGRQASMVENGAGECRFGERLRSVEKRILAALNATAPGQIPGMVDLSVEEKRAIARHKWELYGEAAPGQTAEGQAGGRVVRAGWNMNAGEEPAGEQRRCPICSAPLSDHGPLDLRRCTQF